MRFVLANVLLFSVLSGILYYQYFFQSPVSAMVSSADATAAGALRLPAAVPSTLAMALPPKSLEEKKPDDLGWKFSLNCKNSEQSIVRASDFLILELKKCGKQFPKEMVIENESNGFTASVFSMSATNSKTDSIPLKKGKNVILIKYQLAKSKFKSISEPTPEIIEKLILEH